MDVRETHPTAPEPDDHDLDPATGSDETAGGHASSEEESAPPASGESTADWRSRLWKSSRTAWNWD